MSEQKNTLIEFPCFFPIKIMGSHHPEFELTVLQIIREHAPETEPHQVTIRLSSKGNYLAATANVHVSSQNQLDNIYLALTSHPMIKMVI